MRQLIRSVSGDNFFFYISTILKQETKVFHRKITLAPFIFEKFALSFGKCNRFFFHLFNTNLCTVPLKNFVQALYVSPYRTYLMVGLSLNQKTNNSRLSYLLKYNHSKKEYILHEKINGNVGSNKGEQY